MKVIKGKKEYKLLPGDLIMFNGAVWMFEPRDNSIPPFGTWNRPSNISISKKEAMRILSEYKYFQKEINSIMIYKITL